MNPKLFTSSAPGKIVKTPLSYWAYLPNPLPPSLEISWELANHISEADRALSELAGVARTLPNPHLFAIPFAKKEAVLSSMIEGTLASLSDLFYFEALARVAPSGSQDVKEVRNYVAAMEYAIERIKDFPISIRLFREIHKILMRDTRGEHLTPGELRTSQNWIGSPNCTLMDSTFVPPPAYEMKQSLGDLEKYLHANSVLPPLVRMAIVHYQFEAIHPFLDGNGRIGRLLITLLLCKEELLPVPLLYLSAYFERYRSEYYRLLLEVSQKGSWNDWISFFLRGVAEQSRDAIDRAYKLFELRKSYVNQFSMARSSSLILHLIEELFSHPVITITQAASRLNVTYRSALKIIEKLVNGKVLVEVGERKRNRTFIAVEIVTAIEEEQKNENNQ